MGCDTHVERGPPVPYPEERGFKDSGYNFWVGLFAPAGTPPAVIDRLNAEARKALGSDDARRVRQDRRREDQGKHRSGQEGRHQAAVGENG
jgi:tripartite-type tricarboxylate transporter receptor subunit TctC